MNNEQKKSRQGGLVLSIIITLTVAAVAGVAIYKYLELKRNAADVQAILEQQKTVLEQDLTHLQTEFGTLKTDNDSLQNLAAEQRDKIARLLEIQADNAYKIKMYQKELTSLRGVLKGLMAKVDSLNIRNRELLTEKEELTASLSQEREQSTRLTEDKEKLAGTVQKAQTLSVSDVTVQGLNSRSKETQRVKTIKRLKTCFTVRENQVAEAGERLFYIQIIKPDKQVMTGSDNNTFTAQDGTTLVYTDKRNIEYENKDIEVCVFSDNHNMTAGLYEIKIFSDGVMVGSVKTELKK
ncbi:MAG: hypothetical protein LBF89_07455 [Bacteroidales bacterium]|jgi:DNA repair exonuclease SbcCD ATPase subunit|nr:hypothetical protein [Bacteroidales bacterium]